MEHSKRPDELTREAAGDPPEPLGTRATTIGIVKYWRDDKGYGCIASEKTAPWDIWCHFMHITGMDGFRSLNVGDRVEVEYHRSNQESFRYVAIQARRLDPS